MQSLIYISSILLSILYCKISYSQCNIPVDVSNIQHISCPNGGSVGSATIIQDNYTNYFWQNISTGQTINSVGNTTFSVLDAGLYVITGTDPYNS